jgi:hypothetical protein
MLIVALTRLFAGHLAKGAQGADGVKMSIWKGARPAREVLEPCAFVLYRLSGEPNER